MPNTQKKFLKKKEREKKVKDKVLRRREAIRKEVKEKAEEERRMEAEYELRNASARQEPIVTKPEAIAARDARKKLQVEARLKKNLAILEALEREYDEEHANREQVQENLEAEGHHTVKDKLAALHARAKKLQSMTDAFVELAKKPLDDSVAKEEAKEATRLSAVCDKEPVVEGYTPQRIIEAKEAEDIIREELSSGV